VKNHNSIVDDKAKSQNLCKKQLWEYITENLKDMLDTYTKKTSDNNKALKSIREKRAAIKSEIIELKKEISDKQKDLTSIHPVAENINNVLNKFGFTGFRISIDNEKKGAYKIVRPTGEDASKSLSEGEHNFISFLYYYYLCLGSQNEEYPQRKRVLVIDDPVSSMDSNVLFIVSTLVRDLIRKCKEEGKKTEQIIILTHNVYFYKEITYLGRGSDSNYKYFILRKCSETTSIEEYSSNPINTAYEALWKELENKDEHSTVIIMNVMRRILEYYFTVIGGIQYEKCIDEMEGTDKYICKSLISFINEGSHAIFEDILYQSDEQNIDNYKRVFKEIFNILGHSAHYDMMMKKVK
jgi:wobble nucleotide-excising tRNase